MAYYDEQLAKEISIPAAIFLENLLKVSSHEKPVLYDEIYWIPLSEKSCYEKTALTRKFQRKAIRQLVEARLLLISPPHLFNRRHFHIIERLLQRDSA